MIHAAQAPHCDASLTPTALPSTQDDATGHSALMAAAAAGATEAVEALLGAGAPWNAIDRRGRCAGDYAMEGDHAGAAGSILEAGMVSVPKRCGNSRALIAKARPASCLGARAACAWCSTAGNDAGRPGVRRRAHSVVDLCRPGFILLIRPGVQAQLVLGTTQHLDFSGNDHYATKARCTQVQGCGRSWCWAPRSGAPPRRPARAAMPFSSSGCRTMAKSCWNEQQRGVMMAWEGASLQYALMRTLNQTCAVCCRKSLVQNGLRMDTLGTLSAVA